MMFPIIELVDRYTIALLKYKKTQANQEELDFYKAQLAEYELDSMQEDIDQLYNIHNEIWMLESELKSNREHELALEEIGRRAIAIRNWNNQRIAVKNCLAEKLGCSIREIKRDHLSE